MGWVAEAEEKTRVIKVLEAINENLQSRNGCHQPHVVLVGSLSRAPPAAGACSKCVLVGQAASESVLRCTQEPSWSTAEWGTSSSQLAVLFGLGFAVQVDWVGRDSAPLH